jgi:hypothetical protein
MIHQIGEDLPIGGHDDGTGRDPQDDLGAIGTIAVIALARLAVSSSTMRPMMKLKKGRDVGIDDELYVAAMTAIATIGSAEGFELLPMHGHTAVTAISTGNVEDDTIDEGRHDEPVDRSVRR